MSKIIRKLYPDIIRNTAKRCRERGVVLPTFAQLRDPARIPPSIQRKLKGVGLWDVSPVNLFRITWKNDVKTGLYGGVNYLEIPPAITGVKAPWLLIGLRARTWGFSSLAPVALRQPVIVKIAPFLSSSSEKIGLSGKISGRRETRINTHQKSISEASLYELSPDGEFQCCHTTA